MKRTFGRTSLDIHRNSTFWISILLLSAVSNMVVAQEAATCPSPSQNEQQRRREAGIWFTKGETLADAEQYRAAVEAFTCSIRMVEHPDTIFNAAKAAELAGDKGAAVDFAKRYLALAPDGEVAPQAQKIVQNGANPEPTASTEVPPPKDVPSPPIENQTAEPPEEKTVDAHPPNGTEAPPPMATIRENPQSRPGGFTIAGYACLGTGSAGLVVGAVLQGLSAKAWSDGKSTDSYDQFSSYKSKMENLQTGALVGLIGGGIVAGAGIILLLLDRREHKENITVGMSRSGVYLTGRF